MSLSITSRISKKTHKASQFNLEIVATCTSLSRLASEYCRTLSISPGTLPDQRALTDPGHFLNFSV